MTTLRGLAGEAEKRPCPGADAGMAEREGMR